MSLQSMFEELASRTPQSTPIIREEPAPRCYDHHHDLPCPQCAENKERGYSVRQLAGRCANGFEGGHGIKWHAVPNDDYKAICGATYGRRSAGWSSYQIIGQSVTCPKCIKRLERAQQKMQPTNGGQSASDKLSQPTTIIG